MKKSYISLCLLSAMLLGNVYPTCNAYAETVTTKSEEEASYNADYSKIYKKMKDGMNAAKDTGNVDLDFVLEMIPHHEGGIEMAKAILKYGSNEEVKKIAQNIVTSQEAQIPVMQKLKGEFEKEKPSSKEDNAKYIKEYNETKDEMFKEMESVPLTCCPDETFLRQMIYHHEAAIEMAEDILEYTKNPELKKLAKNIEKTQSKGVKEMKNLLKDRKSEDKKDTKDRKDTKDNEKVEKLK